MSKIVRFIKTHTSILGFAVLVVPLLLLLWFQFVWLNKLERTSIIAHQVAQRNTLDVIANEVMVFYREKANQLLRIPMDLLWDEPMTKVVNRLGNADFSGVRSLYVVKYFEINTGAYFVYRPLEQRFVPATASDESLAVIIACLPWQAWVRGSVEVQSPDFQVNEQDHQHRLILNPILDETKRVIAVVVMVLDEAFMHQKLLPRATRRIAATLTSVEDSAGLSITVRNKANALIYGKQPAKAVGATVSTRFSFVFSDWQLSLHSHGLSPEQWARKSFFYNMALAVLLSVVVMGGTVLALRTADRSMKLSEMKSDFVSNVSHELRTPLASIRVFAEFLRLGKVANDQKVAEYGEYIELETQRLTRLVDNILDFSRIESEQKIYHFAPTDLGTVVETALNAFSLRLKNAGFEVRREIPFGFRAEVSADPDAIGQVLHNLLDNAVKYSKDNRQITVRLAEEEAYYAITVQDAGIGIRRSEQARIFERFHRVSTRLVHDIKGSGLGLSIVYHIMKAHGGTVEVESEAGKGSAFCLRLPKQPPERERTQQTKD